MNGVVSKERAGGGLRRSLPAFFRLERERMSERQLCGTVEDSATANDGVLAIEYVVPKDRLLTYARVTAIPQTSLMGSTKWMVSTGDHTDRKQLTLQCHLPASDAGID